MKRRTILATTFVGIAAITGACSSSDAPKAPPRTMAIAVIPRQIPPPTASDFAAAYQLSYDAGSRGQVVTLTWKDLEPDSGALDLSPLISQVNAASSFPTIFVGIQAINTVAKEVPADLADTPFDDATTIARFHVLIDRIAGALPGRITYLSIGNEVDNYLETTSQWDSYQRFYDDAAAYAHEKMPGVRVGVTGEFGGVTGPLRAKMAALNVHSDIVVITYYALRSDLHVEDPSIARASYAAMLDAAGGKPVVVQEIGYPASPLLGSSDSLQAAFFTDAIAEWADIDASRMPFVSLFLLHDFTPEQCDAFGQYYGLPDNAEFEAYLCTLGLRHADGTPRPAWQAVVSAAAAAGLTQ